MITVEIYHNGVKLEHSEVEHPTARQLKVAQQLRLLSGQGWHHPSVPRKAPKTKEFTVEQLWPKTGVTH